MRKIGLIALLPLIGLIGCGNNKQSNKGEWISGDTRFFESHRDMEFQDENNHFELSLAYDSHLRYCVQFVEYSLDDYAFSMDDVTLSEDAETISFMHNEYNTGKYLTNGAYQIKHLVRGNEEKFSLFIDNTEYLLTEDKQPRPIYLNSDLLGNWENEDNNLEIEIDAENVEKPNDKNFYQYTISLLEGELEFTGAVQMVTENAVVFTVKGNRNGTILVSGKSYQVVIDSDTAEVFFVTEAQNIPLTYAGGHGPVINGFFQTAFMIDLKRTDLTITITHSMPGNGMAQFHANDSRSYMLLPNDAGDELTTPYTVSIACLSSDGEAHAYMFKYYLVSEVAHIDLYEDGTLRFNDLTIVDRSDELES